MTTTYRGIPIKSVEHNRRAGTYILVGTDGEPVAELKQHEFLTQPNLRTLRHGNGGHRKANQTIYGGSFGKSNLPIAPGAVFYTTPAGPIVTWVTGYDPGAPEPAIEDAGIRAGEIRAWRCWKLRDGFLTSMAVDQIVWGPSEPMKQDDGPGVHAWKTLSAALSYARGYGRSIVVGQVDLWGEITEHERGYTAEYAAVASVDYMLQCPFLKRWRLRKLRALYLPKPA